MSGTESPNLGRFWTSFGPGLMWAATAIGVSHLVQSTRAGAMAGFGLVGVVVLALILKYPFFEYGPRYAAATGESLVEGYRRIGRWALWLYLVITLSTALIVQVAVVLFTSFVVKLVFGLAWPVAAVAAALCALCFSLILAGRFRLLDGAIKAIIIALALSTLLAVLITAPRADLSTLEAIPDVGIDGVVSLAFLLALVGWMPSAFDISVWSSLWTLAKDRVTGVRAGMDVVLLDFRIGYIGTGILALAFLTLGATVMYGSGGAFSDRGTEFTGQLVELYTGSLGGWTRPIVYTAVLTTMFSTSLAVVDGFPRAIDRALRVAFLERLPDADEAMIRSRPVPAPGQPYWWGIVILATGTVIVLSVFPGSLTTMVDFATIVSFLTAPALGYLNLRTITSDQVAPELRPGRLYVVSRLA
jgi:Mn2+/Fe2+ NRAMP family transporter